MDLPVNDLGRKLEHEHLAALLAFREGLISPDDLSGAVAEVLDGKGTSVLEVLRLRNSLSVEQIREVHEQAKLCSDMLAAKLRFERSKAKAGGSNASLPPAVFYDEQDQADYYHSDDYHSENPVPLPNKRNEQTGAEQELSLTHSPQQHGDDIGSRANRVAWVDPKQILPPDHELDDEIPEEDFEWRPTSELFSHVYLIEDSLRSLTGGMLGITNTLGLMVFFGIAVWGAIQFDAVNKFFNPDGSKSMAQSTNGGSTEAGEAESTAEGEAPIVLAGQSNEEGELDLTPNAEEEMVVAPEATAAEVLASAPASDKETVEEEVFALDAESASAQSAMIMDAELKIEQKVILAGQDLNRLDYDRAFSHLEKFIESRASTLDLKIDSRWLVLGAALLIQKNTDAARLQALDWVTPLLKSEHPQARLVCAAWLLEASPEQLDLFEQRVQADVGNEASAEVINWLFAASGDKDDVIDAIEAKLEQQQSIDPLNYLFLSLANYNAGRRAPALERLKQLSPLLNNATHWVGPETELESAWTRKAMLSRIYQEARELKSKVEPPKVN